MYTWDDKYVKSYQQGSIKRNAMFPRKTKLGPADYFNYNYATNHMGIRVLGPLGLLLQKAFRLRVEGTENIPKDKNFILMPNHVSHADSFFAISPLWKKTFHFIGDEKLFKSRFFRVLAGIFNVFPVRKKAKSVKIVEYAIARVNNGDNLLWYPEGARNKNPSDNICREGKIGSGMIAHQVDAAIIPVFLSGVEFTMPMRKGWSFGKRFHSIDVLVRYGKPVYMDDLRKLEACKETSRKVVDRIINSIDKLRPKGPYLDQSHKI